MTSLPLRLAFIWTFYPQTDFLWDVTVQNYKGERVSTQSVAFQVFTLNPQSVRIDK